MDSRGEPMGETLEMLALSRVRWETQPIVLGHRARSVRWLVGEVFSFTEVQGRVFVRLLLAWLKGAPDVAALDLLIAARSRQDRMTSLFRAGGRRQRSRHPAIGKLIVAGASRGTYRLAGECPQSLRDAWRQELERILAWQPGGNGSQSDVAYGGLSKRA